MIKTLRTVFSSKAKREAAIIKTANTIRVRNGRPEIVTLEDAVSTVIFNTTAVTTQAVYDDDAEAGRTFPRETYLLPSVLLGMLLTQKMWIAFDEKFDGGKVASYVALGHCLQDPTKDSMVVFTEGAMKYNAVVDALALDDTKLEEILMMLVGTVENDPVAHALKPIYASIREHEKTVPVR